MRMIIPPPALTRLAVAAGAVVYGLTFLGAATARDDLGLHRFWAEQLPAVSAPDNGTAMPRLPLRSAGPIRPLRLALSKRHDRPVARRRPQGSLLAQAPAPRLLSLPVPKKPAIVSLYEDRTLRSGDAVMLADGIHIFRGEVAGLHRPGDFIRLQRVASLNWQLRQSLNDLDRNPPTRWTSLMATPG